MRAVQQEVASQGRPAPHIVFLTAGGQRYTEDLLLQSLYQKFVSCNLFHMKTSCSKFAA